MIFLDAALSQSMLGLDLAPWFIDPNVQFANRGPIVESFVGQELLCYSAPDRRANLYFWKREKRGGEAELDYLYDYEGRVTPIEVKSAHGSTLRSLRLFLETHVDLGFGIRFSTHNYSIIDKIDSRPLYAVSSLAHDEQVKGLQSLPKT